MRDQAARRARRIILAAPHSAHRYSRRAAAESSLARYSPLSFIATLQASQSGAGKAAIRARGVECIGLGDELHVSLLRGEQWYQSELRQCGRARVIVGRILERRAERNQRVVAGMASR